MDDNKVAVGVDIGGTNIKAALVKNNELVGEIIQESTPDSLDEFLKVLNNVVWQLKSRLPGEEVLLGIGVPGIISQKDKKIVYCPNVSFLSGLNFAQLVPGSNTAVGNDADLTLLGEIAIENLWSEDILLLSLGTGLGSAFYAGGRGSWELSLAGEGGHMKLVPDGKMCGCGGHGCLEAYFSGRALLNDARTHIAEGIVEVRELFDLAKSGNENAIHIVNQAAKILGIGIANLVNLLGTDRVILSGKISYSYDFIADLVYNTAKENIFVFDERRFSIQKSGLIDRSPIIGAATLAIKGY